MRLGPFTSDQRAEQRQMVEVNLLGAMTARAMPGSIPRRTFLRVGLGDAAWRAGGRARRLRVQAKATVTP